MRHTRHIKTAILLIAVVCLVYPAFSGDKKGPNGPKEITGEVVEIHRATMAQHGQIDEIVVGDGEGQKWRMRLLTPEGVPGAYQVGDLVRARVMWVDVEDPEQPADETTESAVMRSEDGSKVALVRNMRNWRTGDKIVYRDSEGKLLNQHQVQVKSQFKEKAEDGGHAVETQSRFRQNRTDTAGSGARQGGGGGGRR